jgi:hypothetical protein
MQIALMTAPRIVKVYGAALLKKMNVAFVKDLVP